MKRKSPEDRTLKRHKCRAPLRLSQRACIILCCVACLLMAIPARSSDTNEFLARIYTNAAKKTLAYRLLLPKNYNPTQAYPVIVFLHGAAARGNDNAEPLNWGPRLFLESSLREKHPFFLLVPQCPGNGSWLESSWGGLKALYR